MTGPIVEIPYRVLDVLYRLSTGRAKRNVRGYRRARMLRRVGRLYRAASTRRLD